MTLRTIGAGLGLLFAACVAGLVACSDDPALSWDDCVSICAPYGVCSYEVGAPGTGECVCRQPRSEVCPWDGGDE